MDMFFNKHRRYPTCQNLRTLYKTCQKGRWKGEMTTSLRDLLPSRVSALSFGLTSHFSSDSSLGEVLALV